MAIALRGHLKDQDALWIGSDYFQPFTVTVAGSGAAYDLSGYTAAATLRNFPGSTTAVCAIAATITAPATAGAGLITILGTDSAAVAPGTYSYKVTLTPGVGTSSAAHQPIIIYGDIDFRTR